MSRSLIRARPLAIVALTCALLALTEGRASALDLSGGSCGTQGLGQPFAQWGDRASYVLAPGGTFEPGDTPWDTTDGAYVLSGNEPWQVNSASDGNSLYIPAGSDATSPATCVALDTPTIRFFARSVGGSSHSSLLVNVTFTLPGGGLTTVPIGVVPASSDWTPTQPFVIGVNGLALLGPDYQSVAFSFVPQGDADWQIDDVYVDPWQKG
jgi:hypothetical protein